ncbi:type III pantothenate kinase [Chryseolinea sp. T2]|uniref:type III pantothenate kinase n=1 Tax=Chryseolinea sp. T2 TaxID=3129255 RepID=UPI003077DD35
MMLALDVGNSDITIGLYAEAEWRHVWRIPTITELPAMYFSMRLANQFLESGIRKEEIKVVGISSVVPELTQRLEEASSGLLNLKPIVLGPDIYKKLPLVILKPYEIGSDLVCNAMGAYTMFKRSCVVADFGTALTFTGVSNRGEIVGVSIAPGLRTAIKSLSQHTAKLFDVPLEMPSSVLGKGTTHAIQSGVLIGYEGMVMHMLKKFRLELDPDANAVATGGLCYAIPSLKSSFDVVDPRLTLEGLRLIVNHELNER